MKSVAHLQGGLHLNAGIDPLSSEPFELTMKKMNKVMDQIEEILNK